MFDSVLNVVLGVLFRLERLEGKRCRLSSQSLKGTGSGKDDTSAIASDMAVVVALKIAS